MTDDIVNQAESAKKVLDGQGPCPQGVDCAGDQKHERLFECPDAGCDFLGCCMCYDQHVREPHSSDSDVMREMVRGIGSFE